MTYKIGSTIVGNFKTQREAAEFHFASSAVISICPGLWMDVASGQTIMIKGV